MEDPITVTAALATLTTLGLAGVIALGATIYIAKRVYKSFRG
jgi:hypothetical protein